MTLSWLSGRGASMSLSAVVHHQSGGYDLGSENLWFPGNLTVNIPE